MKKAELHVHLEGSIGPETLLAIDPSLTREEIEANLTCASFPQFLQGYIWVSKKLEKPGHYAPGYSPLTRFACGPGRDLRRDYFVGRSGVMEAGGSGGGL